MKITQEIYNDFIKFLKDRNKFIDTYGIWDLDLEIEDFIEIDNEQYMSIFDFDFEIREYCLKFEDSLRDYIIC